MPSSFGVIDGGVLRFHFLPRDAKVWKYVTRSDVNQLDGKSGAISAIPPPHSRTSEISVIHPYWWIDDPDPTTSEGIHPGAKSVNQWREEFLRDFAERMDRGVTTASTQVKRVIQKIADAPSKEVSQQHEVIQKSTHLALNTRARSISFLFIAAIPRACFLHKRIGLRKNQLDALGAVLSWSCYTRLSANGYFLGLL